MAHSVSARKRIRQNLSRNARNRSVRADIRTRMKTLADLVAKKESDQAMTFFKLVLSKIDKAKKNEIIHGNKAARLKSKLALLMNRLGQAPVASAN